MTEPFDAHIALRAGGVHVLPTRPPRAVIRRIVMAPRGRDQE